MDTIKNLDELLDVLEISILDVYECQEDLKKLDEPNPKVSESDIERLKDFRKRNYVRVVFASIESILFAMKRIILEDLGGTSGFKITSDGFEKFHSKSKLSSKDIIKLQEYKLVGPDENNLEEIPAFTPILENIKDTFNKYALIRTNQYKTNFNCKDWEYFQESVKIRNKITHPKLSSDLNISDKEFEYVKDSYNWFNKIFEKLRKEEYG